MTADVLTSGTDRPQRRLSRWARTALVAAGLAAGAVALVLTRPPAVPAPTLTVLADSAAVTTSGVIVVTVELRGAAAAVEVRSAELIASPVLQPPSVTKPRRVAPDGTGRLVAIVQPDCRALDPSDPAWQEASLRVRVATGPGEPGDGREREVRLELRDEPTLLGRLRGLCGRVGRDREGLSVGFLEADERRVTATIGVDGGPEGVEVRSVGAPGLSLASREVDRPVRVAAGAGVSLQVEVTVADCFAVRGPAPGTDPDAFLWGLPEVELADPDGTVTRSRPEPAAVSDLYSTAVRRLVQNACGAPPR